MVVSILLFLFTKLILFLVYLYFLNFLYRKDSIDCYSIIVIDSLIFPIMHRRVKIIAATDRWDNFFATLTTLLCSYYRGKSMLTFGNGENVPMGWGQIVGVWWLRIGCSGVPGEGKGKRISGLRAALGLGRQRPTGGILASAIHLPSHTGRVRQKSF